MLADYPNADTIMVGGNVAAPGAGADIVSAGTPPKGYYEVLVSVAVGAGAVAADNGNAQLRFNGAIQIGALTTPGGVHRIPRILLDGTNVMRLQAVGAATAAVVYTGTIMLTRIG